MSLVKAHPEVGRPTSERGLLNKGCKNQCYPWPESPVNKLFTVSNGRSWTVGAEPGSLRRRCSEDHDAISSAGPMIVRCRVRICPDLSRFVWIGPDPARFRQISSMRIHELAGSCIGAGDGEQAEIRRCEQALENPMLVRSPQELVVGRDRPARRIDRVDAVAILVANDNVG